jgi:precorrin-3B synthase
MQTGDGLLARLALSRPDLTPVTLSEIANAAAEYGNGLLDITARGNIQIRGLTPASVAPLAARIEALDILAPDSPAIAINPLAGVDPAVLSDPLNVAEQLRALIEPTMILAPKMTIVIDGGGLVTLDAQTADIRLVAVENGWSLALAGDTANAVRIAIVPLDQAASAAFRLLKLFASRGPTTRARDFLDTEGVAPVSAALADIACAPPPASSANRSVEFIGHHIMSNGQPILGIVLSFGQINAATLIELAQTAARFGATTIHPAPGRALLIVGLSPDTIAPMTHAANALGLITDPTDPRIGIAACSGKPACASGHFETRAVARIIAAEFPQLTKGKKTVHISGCAKGCARPSKSDFVLAGRPDGIGIVLDGRADDIAVRVLPQSPPSALVATIIKVLETTK